MLDAFAGSGALGIEALSRGAAYVDFVEKNSVCLKTLNENLELVGTDGYSVIKGDVLKIADRLKSYDIIFLDPPYDEGLYIPFLEKAAENGLVKKGSKIVIECRRTFDFILPKMYNFIKKKDYGDISLWFLEYGDYIMKCVYAGSFDPITCGHVDIIERAAGSIGEVIIAVPVNIDKKYVFTLEQRIELIKKATEHIDGVSVSAAEGLLVDFVKESGAGLIVKGLRTMSDFEYEFQMASINRTLSKEIDTVFMMSDPEFSYLSSSLVREVIFHGGDIKGLVPGCIIEDIKTYIGG